MLCEPLPPLSLPILWLRAVGVTGVEVPAVGLLTWRCESQLLFSLTRLHLHGLTCLLCCTLTHSGA